MRIFLSLVGVMLCAQVVADEIDLSVNSDAVRLMYGHSFRANELQFSAGWLNDSDKGDVVNLDLQLVSDATEGNTPVKAGLGGRVAWFDGKGNNQTGIALGIGGFFRYPLPRYNRFSVGGYLYYAPDVLSFSDGSTFIDTAVRISYNVLREADVFVGARYVKGEYDSAPDVKFDTGLHVGINLRF